jgi:hypothetical protein
MIRSTVQMSTIKKVILPLCTSAKKIIITVHLLATRHSQDTIPYTLFPLTIITSSLK